MIVMIVSIVFAVMFLVLAVIFLMGKGDMLIAGYNTAFVGIIIANTWAKKK